MSFCSLFLLIYAFNQSLHRPLPIKEITSENPADFAPISENDKIFKEVSEDSEEDVKELDQSISTDLFMQVASRTNFEQGGKCLHLTLGGSI